MSTVELMRDTDGPELVAALEAHGMHGEIVDYDNHVAVQVEDCDELELTHCIEDWLDERHLPFVPLRIDGCTFAVAPPAG